MEQTYVWIVRVYHKCDDDGTCFSDQLMFKKAFTSKTQALKYKVSMENKGYATLLEKYFG